MKLLILIIPLAILQAPSILAGADWQMIALIANESQRLEQIRNARNATRSSLENLYTYHDIEGYGELVGFDQSLENLVATLTSYIEEGNQLQIPLDASLSMALGMPMMANFGQKKVSWLINDPLSIRKNAPPTYIAVPWSIDIETEANDRQIVELNPALPEEVMVRNWSRQLPSDLAHETLINVLYNEIIAAQNQLEMIAEKIQKTRENNNTLQNFIIPLRRLETAQIRSLVRLIQCGAIHQGKPLGEMSFLANNLRLKAARPSVKVLDWTYDMQLAWVPASLARKEDAKTISVGWDCRMIFKSVNNDWILKELRLRFAPSQDFIK